MRSQCCIVLLVAVLLMPLTLVGQGAVAGAKQAVAHKGAVDVGNARCDIIHPSVDDSVRAAFALGKGGARAAAGGSVAADVSIEGVVRPLPNFDASVYPMEGCEPLTIDFINHSQNVDAHRWVFSDGFTSTEPSPSHTFAAGTYDLRYYAYNDNGSVDSIVMPSAISVFKNPTARFEWTPSIPVVSDPTILLQSQSLATGDTMQYLWDVQTDAADTLSFQTVEGDTASFTWPLAEDADAARYKVRLIAVSHHHGPSGQLHLCNDTTNHYVYIINDLLRYPTLVTPNGDGINDVFAIVGLVRGGAYPVNMLDIYTHWGVRVFHAENIEDENDFWSPEATHSPAGTYFFRFRARGFTGMIDHSGVIEVIR